MATPHELPELDHNELVGWEGAREVGPFTAIFLDDPDLHPRVHDRIEHYAGTSRRRAGGLLGRAGSLTPHGVEVAVVAGSHHGREHGRVVPRAGARPRVDCVLNERERLR